MNREVVDAGMREIDDGRDSWSEAETAEGNDRDEVRDRRCDARDCSIGSL